MNPWSTEDIEQARVVGFSSVLDFIGAYHKQDRSYASLNPNRKTVRVEASYQGKNFRFLFTGAKWFDELRRGGDTCGGGGAIDFVRYVTGLKFVAAVKICLDAKDVYGRETRP